MKIKFYGAAQTVTGSRFLIETYDRKILIDCGLFQGPKELRLRNWQKPPFDPSEIDAVVLTHAHIDHSGYLPVLVREGFRGPIYATQATCDLCEILLKDSAHIQEEDARRANKYGYSKHKPAKPLYTEEDAAQALRRFKPFEYGRDLALADELVVTASHAGHIFGSAILSLREGNTSLVFSGDLGRSKDPVMRKPAEIQTADYLILESTYGNRLHPPGDGVPELAKAINTTVARGGMVLIPAFAVGRTQTMLYLINSLKSSGEIPNIPVYLDSPMAQNATELMCHHLPEHRLPKALCEKVCYSAHYLRTPEESKSLNGLKEPAIIISASGMIEGGRVLHHVKRLAPHKENTIIFAGFQAAMTRGDRILSGEKEVKIHGEAVPIRCQVEYLENLSSHADYEETLAWLKGFRSKPHVFLTHGEPESCSAFKKRIEERFGWEVSIPKYGDVIQL